MSKLDIITLASLIEKEAHATSEKPLISSVFHNRMILGMRLQSDPTVLYGLFKGAGKPQGYMLAKADIEKASPYNTYMIAGLPPGPIANPGRASLEAVANPSRTRDLFFVADGTGGHAFAETYEQHLKNVARWRDISANAGAALTGGSGAPDAGGTAALPPAATGGAAAAPTAATDASTAAPPTATDSSTTTSGGADVPIPVVRPAIANPPPPKTKAKTVTAPVPTDSSLDGGDDSGDAEGAAGQ